MSYSAREKSGDEADAPKLRRLAGLIQACAILLDDIEHHAGTQLFWTFGGGTVLMLRYQHRRSKDIDIFYREPQALGYVTPRLSPAAENISRDYVETANHVKLIRSEGEIDFVASPNLTKPGFETWEIEGHSINVETSVEIIAKKMWHRGAAVTARDLFDLALVIEREPKALQTAAQFIVRHRDSFVEQLKSRRRILSMQFNEIDAWKYQPTFPDCVDIAERFLKRLSV
jgi:Nucleotidyl transferase AbiEii toxin, Type IV TA system